MRYVDIDNYFLGELKDQGLLVIKHILGDSNDADIFVKNVTSAIFNLHRPLYIGNAEYLSQTRASSGEAIKGSFCTHTWNRGSAPIFESGLS